MNPNDPNVAMIEVVADALGRELSDEMVFVGGAAAGMLITDPAMPSIRPTLDVDTIFEALALADYHRFEKRLRARGFVQDLSPGAPICRWQVRAVTVDAMPTNEDVMGFSNRWYPLPLRLPRGKYCRVAA